MAADRYVLGIDLGGTKISTALVSRAGEIASYDYRETLAEEGVEAVVGRMLDAARLVMGQRGVGAGQVMALGVGSPGPLDSRAGVVVAPPNLPGWSDVPLKRLLEDGLGIPVFLENDANAAAVGEYRFGAGQGVDHMIYVTVSTGIGGGLILDGRLYGGACRMAGEVGHVTVVPDGPVCNCGNRGCLEAVASATAIERDARRRVAAGASTLMIDLAGGDVEKITAKVVAQAADRGDEEAQRILAAAMAYLGIGMANLVNLFNPQLIVIGGGLANIGDALFGPVRRAIDERAFRSPAEAVRVVPAALGDKVGVLGAAAIALTPIS